MPQPWHHADDRLLVRKLCVGRMENNAYVVACAVTRQAVIIDAAAEPSRLLSAVTDLEPRFILTTHGHWDHVQAAAAVRAALGVPLLIHPADVALAGIEPDAGLGAGSIELGNLRITVMPTPGHTPGSTCFAVDSFLFSGDTLFPGGPGATSGPDAFATIMESLETTLFAHDDETIVLPGHGLDTTIGAERPSLPTWRARGW